MNFEQIFAVSIFAISATSTPGPNNIMLAATGSSFGIRSGLAHLFGVVLGFSFMIFAVTLGLAGLFLNFPAFLIVLRKLCIVAIFWLSWRIMAAPLAANPSPSQASKSKQPSEAASALANFDTAEKSGASVAESKTRFNIKMIQTIKTRLLSGKRHIRPINFFEAAVFQWINPKAWTVISAVIGLHFNQNESILLQAITFSLIFIIVGSMLCFLWLASGTFIRQYLLRTPVLARGFNVVMALLLLSTLYFIF